MNRENAKTCCFTGRRILPDLEIARIRLELRKRIEEAIKRGYTEFISGFADGADIIAAQTVLELRDENEDYGDIHLYAYLPYRKRGDSKKLQGLLDECCGIDYASEYYNRGCYYCRNKRMVDKSQLVIAVSDGNNSGGTGYTLEYARKKGVKIEEISVTEKSAAQ
ncbi:SLOG family protein [Lachnospiraceae bacterium NSJ-143]|nr:SLOG family protein [Lachnospiraceae bacterium NSJ-143]